MLSPDTLIDQDYSPIGEGFRDKSGTSRQAYEIGATGHLAVLHWNEAENSSGIEFFSRDETMLAGQDSFNKGVIKILKHLAGTESLAPDILESFRS